MVLTSLQKIDESLLEWIGTERYDEDDCAVDCDVDWQ